MTLEELKKLKVGNEVCCCDFKHRKIAKLDMQKIPCWPIYPTQREFSNRVLKFLTTDCALVMWFPVLKTYDLLLHMLETVWFERLIDIDITFSDGFACSAAHCCDTLPHRQDQHCPGPSPGDDASEIELALWHKKFELMGEMSHFKDSTK